MASIDRVASSALSQSLPLERHPAGVEAFDVEDVVDQADQPVGVVDRDLDHLATRGRSGRPAGRRGAAERTPWIEVSGVRSSWLTTETNSFFVRSTACRSLMSRTKQLNSWSSPVSMVHDVTSTGNSRAERCSIVVSNRSYVAASAPGWRRRPTRRSKEDRSWAARTRCGSARPDDLVPGQPERALRLGVPLGDLAVAVELDVGVTRGGDDAPRALLALAQGLGRGVPLGDVEDRSEDGGRPPVLVRDHLATCLDHDHAAVVPDGAVGEVDSAARPCPAWSWRAPRSRSSGCTVASQDSTLSSPLRGSMPCSRYIPGDQSTRPLSKSTPSCPSRRRPRRTPADARCPGAPAPPPAPCAGRAWCR